MSEKMMEENEKNDVLQNPVSEIEEQEASGAPDENLCVSRADEASGDILDQDLNPDSDPDSEEENEKKKEGKGTIRSAFFQSFGTKHFRFGMYSTSATALAIVLVIAVNILCGHLPGSLNNVDLSSADIYSIGAETENLLEELDQEVTITVLSSEDTADENIDRLLDQYRHGSKKITVRYVDTETDPAAASQYENLSANSLIVSSENGESVIDYYDIYQTDFSSYYTDGTTSTSFDGEGQITSAIYKVTSGDALSLYVLTGHGEAALGSSVSSMIAKQNMLVSDLNLLSSGIPEDCVAVIVNGPVRDLSTEEADQLIQYISDGGSVMVLLSFTDEEMTNLKRVLRTYQVQLADGIVMETSGHCVSYPINILSGIASSEITDSLASEKANILFTNAIGLLASDSDTVTVTELLNSSDGAYAKIPENGSFATLEKASGDQEGPFSFAVLAEDGAEGGKLAVISSETLVEDAITQQYPVENLTFFMNCMTALCGERVASDSVSIEPKSLDIEYLTIPALHQMLWFFACVILIPVGVFVTGLVIWLVRRKK